MNNKLIKAEHIIWLENGIEVNVAGFVIEENDSYIKLSLTKSYYDYIDVETIQKNKVISRSAL